MSEFKTERLKTLGVAAKKLATKWGHEHITLEHLSLATLHSDSVTDILEGMNVDVDQLAADFDQHMGSNLLSKSARVGTEPKATKEFQNAIQRATVSLVFSGREEIIDLDVVRAICQESDSYPSYLFQKNGLDLHELDRYLSSEGADSAEEAEVEKAKNDPKMRKAAEEFLAKFCENLNERAKAGRVDPLIGRETEIYSVIKTLARRTKNNSVLIGEAGVGKTAVVEGLAKLIEEKHPSVPDLLIGSTIYALSPTALVAGTKYRGEMEERMKNLMDFIKFIPKAILFIDELHMIMGAGAAGSSSMDMGNILKPALARGELRCIGSTTREEYRAHFEKDAAMARRFQKITIDEPSVETAKRILMGAKSVYEKEHGVSYTDEAIDAAVELTHRYIADRFLPDKAFDVIDAAGAVQRIAHVTERKAVITVEEISKEVAISARIPLSTISENATAKLLRLDTDIKTKVFGQDKAVDTLVDAVFEARSGLRRADKTAGSFLFTGPTGVGKTEAAKQLAETLGIPLIRYDMSEYMEAHSVSKLIGSPPGYVGYMDGATGSGRLVTDIEDQPNCVLLLDEIEKAHPQVYNVFLQVMDDGKIKSSSGKEVRFGNVILIMTSNVGAAESEQNAIGFGSLAKQGADEAAIKKHFTPEFRNRLDAIVGFNRLGEENIHRIVRKFIGDLNVLSSDKNVEIVVSDEAIAWLAKKGFDPKMGARPMARTIRTEINAKLSREILFGRLKDGGKVEVELSGDELTFSFPSEKVDVETETLELIER